MLSLNKSWAKAQKEKEPDFFRKMAQGQSPLVFWIGCCDSRVVPSSLLNLPLGEVFVQTNIANQVNGDDVNTMSSLAYAVEVLEVEHIVVCGHTRCGGVEAAMSDTEDIPFQVREWVRPIARLYQDRKNDLPRDPESERQTAMSCLNVRFQLETLTNLDLIRNRWRAGKGPELHGWLFRVEEGIVESLVREPGRGSTLR